MTKPSREHAFGKLFLLANRVQSKGDRLFPGLPLKQCFLLLLLLKQKSPPTLNTLAGDLGTTRQNVKKMLDSLEKKGYLSQSRSTADNRALAITPTGKAYAFLDSHKKSGLQFVDELFAGVTPADLEALNRVFNRLGKNLKSMEGTYHVAE